MSGFGRTVGWHIVLEGRSVERPFVCTRRSASGNIDCFEVSDGGQMKRSLLISVAALACACGGSHQSDNRDASAPAGSSQPASTGATAQTVGGDQGGATRANQTVTLVGCLVGPSQAAAPRSSSAARAQARATGPETAADAAGAASADRFMLADAVVPGSELGGVGANGAGGSGGPLVSGRATFELDGVPPDARNSVNKQVKVVGRLDARPAGDADAANGAAGAAGTSGSGTAPTAASGSVPSGSSDAPGAHGTGQKSVAGHGTMGSAARSDVRNQRLVVETVQVIAENCTQR